ncbi:MAG: hypothetical protein ACR2QW_14055 [bacterium]
MNLKTMTDNLLVLIALAAGAYGLYYYMKSPQEPTKATARYLENEQETRFDQIEDAKGNLDDCYRYANADSVEACIERRTRENAKE